MTSAIRVRRNVAAQHARERQVCNSSPSPLRATRCVAVVYVSLPSHVPHTFVTSSGKSREVEGQLRRFLAYLQGRDQPFDGSGSHMPDRVRGQATRCTTMSVSWPIVLGKKCLLRSCMSSQKESKFCQWRLLYVPCTRCGMSARCCSLQCREREHHEPLFQLVQRYLMIIVPRRDGWRNGRRA